MKKIIAMTALIFSSILTYACTDGAKQKQAETQETTQDGSVIVMRNPKSGNIRVTNLPSSTCTPTGADPAE